MEDESRGKGSAFRSSFLWIGTFTLVFRKKKKIRPQKIQGIDKTKKSLSQGSLSGKQLLVNKPRIILISEFEDGKPDTTIEPRGKDSSTKHKQYDSRQQKNVVPVTPPPPTETVRRFPYCGIDL
ncbi:hypothetical protein STEG23_026811 [Scotinomys teguina]